MASLLGVEFTFPKPGSRQRKSALPDIQLVSLLVISVKLYHPFDSQARYSRSLTEFGTLVIDWGVWCNYQIDYATRHTSAGKLGRGNEIYVNENDVMAMSGEQLDDYLDWYEKTWVKDEPQEPHSQRIPQQLLNLFPTGRPDGSSPAKVDFNEEAKANQIALNQKLENVQGSLKLRSVVSEESEESSEKSVKRIGSFYKRYRNVEELSPQAKTFYDAAASLAGVSLSTLLLAVLQLERKLELLREKDPVTDLLESDNFLSEEEHLEGDHEGPMIDDTHVDREEERLDGNDQEPGRNTDDEIAASPDAEPAVAGSASDSMEQE